MSQWYPVYDDTTKDVEGAGFFAEPETFDPGTGKTLGSGQPGAIPEDLKDADDPTICNYTYNTSNNLVEAKA